MAKVARMENEGLREPPRKLAAQIKLTLPKGAKVLDQHGQPMEYFQGGQTPTTLTIPIVIAAVEVNTAAMADELRAAGYTPPEIDEAIEGFFEKVLHPITIRRHFAAKGTLEILGDADEFGGSEGPF